DHWKRYFCNARMQVSIAGAVDPAMVADWLEGEFDGFNDGSTGASAVSERPSFTLNFSPTHSHFPKELEQEQIAICFPGVGVVDDDHSVQRIIIGVLSGGMGARLFTEVREKQGLVYWVGAWRDQPRKGGMIHLGASTTPQNIDKTYTSLLREIDRLSEDVSENEIERAVAGIVTRVLTRGDVTRAKAAELANDLFYYGHPVSREEELEKVRSVRVSDVRQFLDNHPRDKLSVVALGPVELRV
ncbi:MAG: insulinase family protein, partial [Planctomycetota bacterium]